MSIWSPTYQQSVFKRYHSDKHFSEFLPTRWRRKPAGIDLEQNYVTVILCVSSHNGQQSRIWGARGEGLSGVEGLLAVVGLEMTTEGIRTGTGIRRDGGREFQILGAAALRGWSCERRMMCWQLSDRSLLSRTGSCFIAACPGCEQRQAHVTSCLISVQGGRRFGHGRTGKMAGRGTKVRISAFHPPASTRRIVKSVSAYGLSNNNKWRWRMWMAAAYRWTHSLSRFAWSEK